MPTSSGLLAIDAEKAVAILLGYIKELVRRESADGVVIGLSGGLDSSLLTALCIRALGQEKVHAYYLYDRDSEEALARRARQVAEGLGCRLEEQDISAAMSERRIYAPLIMRIVAHSQGFNRLIQRSFILLTGDSPFVATLKDREPGLPPGLERGLYNRTIRHISKSFDERHIHRRQILETEAKTHNALLLGAANRSESMVGWFVKGGIDDLPLQPLSGLYKTQVRQLSAHLDLPSAIVEQPPSPDMLKGIHDEFALGISYARLDIILDLIESGMGDQNILSRGITAQELAHVKKLHALSAWKRSSPHETPPVDGGPDSPLRLQTPKRP